MCRIPDSPEWPEDAADTKGQVLPYLTIKRLSSSAKLFAFSELSVQCMLSTSEKSLGTCPQQELLSTFITSPTSQVIVILQPLYQSSNITIVGKKPVEAWQRKFQQYMN